MTLKGLKKRYYLWRINRLRPFKHTHLKSKLFNKIPGCSIGKNSTIVGPIYLNGTSLTIGDDCFIGHDLKCEGNGSIQIGNRCDIAPNVTFLTGSHEIGNKERRAGFGKTLKIIIADSCWIGANTIILGKEDGLVVNESSVVGCASNVLNNVESSTLVAGNPARLIKKLED